MPKVSVVIPLYNREKYIAETIESVLLQTFKDFEIIIIDDGSTDNSLKNLEPFKEKVKLITQINSERAVSRNNGVKNSTGEYIAFLDSDDIWLPNKLEKQIEILDKNKEIVLVYCACNRIDENSKKTLTARRQRVGYSGNISEKLLIRNFIPSPTPILRRELFNQTEGFKSEYIPYEDWEFWIRFSHLGKFHFIEEPLALYRIHKEQSVQLVSAERIEKATLALLEDSYKTINTSKELKNKSLGVANLRFCYWYLLANDISKAKEKINKAIELNPGFMSDPKWHGLNLICKYPKLKKLGLEKLHSVW